MTDVREMALQAAQQAFREKFVEQMWLTDDETSVIVDAALSAIGYEEIVGALEDLLANYEAAVHQLHGTSGNNEFESEDERIIAAARAALRKARGGPTIVFEPAECGPGCTSPSCHLMHGDSWWVGDISYQTEAEARAAIRKSRGEP